MMQRRAVGCKVAVELARKRGTVRQHRAITFVEPDWCAAPGACRRRRLRMGSRTDASTPDRAVRRPAQSPAPSETDSDRLTQTRILILKMSKSPLVGGFHRSRRGDSNP
jgi:hypothetical protein